MRRRLGSRPPRLDRVTELVAFGHAYPRVLVDNDDFFARCEVPITDDHAALVAETRMRRRAWCGPGEDAWTLARDAVAMALGSGRARADDVDLVVVTSCSAAELAPRLLQELGRDDAVGLDLVASHCAGFLRGLELVDAMLDNPDYRAGLLVATDQRSRSVPIERERSALRFIAGDAAGAVVLRKRPANHRVGLVDYLSHNVADRAAAFDLMLGVGRRLLARNQLKPDDIDWFVPAPAHVLTVESLCDGLRIARDRLLWSGDVTGDAASAGIPASLSARRLDGIVRPGDLVLSIADGAGSAVAAALYHA